MLTLFTENKATVFGAHLNLPASIQKTIRSCRSNKKPEAWLRFATRSKVAMPLESQTQKLTDSVFN